MNTARGFWYLLVGLALVWILLTATFQLQELVIGAVVVVVLALAARSVVPLYSGMRGGIRPILFLPGYAAIFVWQLILANLDMARRVLSPRLPINPGIVRVRTKLRSPLGKLVLSNSITLTPGTLTMDVKGQDLLVHWVDVQGEDRDAATREIVSRFERGLSEVTE